MKIGIFGGTFNPIHNSHIYIIEKFYDILQLDKVIVMPTFIPPHKTAKDLADSKDRLEMCRLATDKMSYAEVSSYEIDKKGKSYTYETLNWVKDKYPENEIYLLMGSDMFFTIDEWKNPEEIYTMATLCVIPREPKEHDNLKLQQQKLNHIGARSIILEITPKPMSSTEIRDRVRNKESLEKFLNPKVIEYIEMNRLYSGE